VADDEDGGMESVDDGKRRGEESGRVKLAPSTLKNGSGGDSSSSSSSSSSRSSTLKLWQLIDLDLDGGRIGCTTKFF